MILTLVYLSSLCCPGIWRSFINCYLKFWQTVRSVVSTPQLCALADWYTLTVHTLLGKIRTLILLWVDGWKMLPKCAQYSCFIVGENFHRFLFSSSTCNKLKKSTRITPKHQNIAMTSYALFSSQHYKTLVHLQICYAHFCCTKILFSWTQPRNHLNTLVKPLGSWDKQIPSLLWLAQWRHSQTATKWTE